MTHPIYKGYEDEGPIKKVRGTRSAADATFVNPRTPADDAEDRADKIRRKAYGGPATGLFTNLSKSEQAKRDLNNAGIDAQMAKDMHRNVRTGKVKDEAKIDRETADIESSAKKAIDERKKYPKQGRTGPG